MSVSIIKLARTARLRWSIYSSLSVDRFRAHDANHPIVPAFSTIVARLNCALSMQPGILICRSTFRLRSDPLSRCYWNRFRSSATRSAINRRRLRNAGAFVLVTPSAARYHGRNQTKKGGCHHYRKGANGRICFWHCGLRGLCRRLHSFGPDRFSI
jgi:hypothetical protein